MALHERDRAVLVERRADNDAREWAFIGGRVDENETILDALHREVREETGFEIESTALFGLISDPTRIIAYPDGNVARFVSVVFRVVPRGNADPVLSDESLELRFVGREELATLDFWPAHRPVRDAFLADPGEVVLS